MRGNDLDISSTMLAYEDGAPDPEKVKFLIACPECGAKYCIDGIRRGPCIISFSTTQYQAMCLNCWHKTKKARTEDKAIEYWNQAKGESKLKELRLAAGLRMEDLQHLSGVDKVKISMIERNMIIPQIEDREKLAAALNVEVSLI